MVVGSSLDARALDATTRKDVARNVSACMATPSMPMTSPTPPKTRHHPMESRMTTIRLKRLPHGEGLPMPTRATPDSSGFDLCAAVTADLVIAPGARSLVPTGLCMEIPRGMEVQVRPRSGLAIKHGVTVLNTPGTVDADYRGEVCVILINLGTAPFTIRRGDRVAQAVPASVALDVTFEEAGDLSDTQRGAGGFGSSGVSGTGC
jgi:deoxyuridine 5'-triphosphate nucleotidohydrolase